MVAESDENEPIGGELHTPDVIHETHDHLAGTTVLGEDLSELTEVGETQTTNAIAAGKAINAAKMAMWGDGTHRVSLDEVIETMWSTGEDMSHKYKETAMGGLAVNVVEC
ncbi:hypothetical protein HMPREF0183_0803 [Brevibacterium mcbrellneri ATCC 49030]|uniref:L-serine ammonia-lyase n=1 Tax=Brevibacterium mcbrellneri ATCC 49030 TaxID=585530 RepID=D4YLJ3_9MICO|nr:hypothetical protein HMPREF0183_0803 [Brevibacterium mcbrellneri ATCC 49030]